MSLNNSLITKLRESSLTVNVCEVGEYIDERYGQVTCVVARDESWQCGTGSARERCTSINSFNSVM